MVTKLKPYNPSAGDVEADWHVLDARGKVLGRLASDAAMLLMGKHRPQYVPHLLTGDFVVITNAAEVKVTGNKADQIVYKRHSQKPGKLKEIPYRRVQETFPERIIEHAVRGMLPKNKLGERMIKRLKVYAGDEHPHVSQLAWTASRPEREAAAAAAAAEAASKKASSTKRTAAKKTIADEAAAKSPAATAAVVEPEAKEKKTSTRKSASKTTTTREKSESSSKAEAKPKTRARKSTSSSAAKKPAAKKPAAAKDDK